MLLSLLDNIIPPVKNEVRHQANTGCHSMSISRNGRKLHPQVRSASLWRFTIGVVEQTSRAYLVAALVLGLIFNSNHKPCDASPV